MSLTYNDDVEFNRYVWELYLESQSGQEMVGHFSNFKNARTDERYQMDLFGSPAKEAVPLSDSEEDQEFWRIAEETRKALAQYDVQSIEAATSIYLEFIDESCKDTTDLELFLSWIAPISVGFHLAFSNFFVPYGFVSRYYLLEQTARIFQIDLPGTPSKRDLEARVKHYADVNEALIRFMQLHNMNSSEMCAFLYDFALNFLDQNKTELPAPSQAWLLLGSKDENGDFEFLDESNATTTDRWQAHVDTQRGDIMVMYVVSPRSHIHSIWRAESNGFQDPFFYFQNTTWISNPRKVMPITFKEMKDHPTLGQNKYILANLQGASGKLLRSQDYDAILEMLYAKGQDITALPRLPRVSFIPPDDLKSERDVELRLVEPLLARLGFSTNDWKRQVPIKMGRGERYYPDYVFGLRGNTREETARMVLETKFSLSRQRDVREAYQQMRSYATRLQASTAMLAAREGVWVFDASGRDFQFDRHQHWNWDELEDGQHFNKLRQFVGKTR